MHARLPIWLAVVSLVVFTAMAPSAEIGGASPQTPEEPELGPPGGQPRFDSDSDPNSVGVMPARTKDLK